MFGLPFSVLLPTTTILARTMEITIYHNPGCSKSRKTLELIQNAGFKPTVVEYLVNPPDAARLTEILTMLSLEAIDLARTQESVFAELQLGEKSLSEGEIVDAMVQNPILIERPIVVADGKAVIGRPPEKVLELLG